MKFISFAATFAAGAVLAFGVTPAAAAGDIAKGEELAARCVACHGEAGKSAISKYPRLCSQHEEYLLKSLTAFRDGKRDDPEMAPQVMIYEDEDLAGLAAYFAAQKCD